MGKPAPGFQRQLWKHRRCAPCREANCRERCLCGCHQPTRCRSCHALIWWGKTGTGKPCPYDYDEEQRAATTPHFVRCPHGRQWAKR